MINSDRDQREVQGKSQRSPREAKGTQIQVQTNGKPPKRHTQGNRSDWFGAQDIAAASAQDNSDDQLVSGDGVDTRQLELELAKEATIRNGRVSANRAVWVVFIWFPSKTKTVSSSNLPQQSPSMPSLDFHGAWWVEIQLKKTWRQTGFGFPPSAFNVVVSD